MRNTIAATLVAVFFAAGLVGCKSAPKLAFWKAGDKTAAVGEETVLANSAPALPADIARQAESLAMSSPAIDMGAPAISMNVPAASGGLATPYTPTINVAATNPAGSGAKPAPAAYPATGASPYSTAAAPVMAAITPTQSPMAQSPVVSAAPHADSLGSVSLPYNPNAVPPARTIAAAPATLNATAGRYGSSALASTSPAYTVPVPAIVPVKPSGAGRYGSIAATPVATSVSPAITSAPSVNVAAIGSVTPSVPKSDSVYGNPAAAGMNGGRYTSTAPLQISPSQPVITPTPTLKASPVSAPSIASAPAVTPAPAIASASAPNYRPGGTASYQGATPSLSTVEIATRPKPYKVETTPSTRYEPVPTPRYR